MLEELVDFNYKFENGEIKLIKFKTHEISGYCDDEIFDVSLKDINSVDNLFIDASKIKWIEYDEKIKLKRNTFDKLITFKSEDDNMIMFFVSLSYKKYDNIKFYGLMKINTKEYVFVGNEGYHPFIESHSFAYGNSDGSGPELNYDSHDDQELLCQMQHYYKEFMADEYH